MKNKYRPAVFWIDLYFLAWKQAHVYQINLYSLRFFNIRRIRFSSVFQNVGRALFLQSMRAQRPLHAKRKIHCGRGEKSGLQLPLGSSMHVLFCSANCFMRIQPHACGSCRACGQLFTGYVALIFAQDVICLIEKMEELFIQFSCCPLET